MAQPAEPAGDKPEKLVDIEVNKTSVQVPKETTGGAIKAAADVPPDFNLFLRQGREMTEIANDEAIHVHENEKFVAVSGQDVS